MTSYMARLTRIVRDFKKVVVYIREGPIQNAKEGIDKIKENEGISIDLELVMNALLNYWNNISYKDQIRMILTECGDQLLSPADLKCLLKNWCNEDKVVHPSGRPALMSAASAINMVKEGMAKIGQFEESEYNKHITEIGLRIHAEAKGDLEHGREPGTSIKFEFPSGTRRAVVEKVITYLKSLGYECMENGRAPGMTFIITISWANSDGHVAAMDNPG